jgi:DNA-binding NarL/FixJ family response regulator
VTSSVGLVRVLICDDDPLIREALREVLQAAPDIAVVAVATSTDEAIALAERHAPTVAVLDIRMPGGGGPRVARELRARFPGIGLLAFSAYGDARSVDDMRQAGVRDHLLKGARNTEIVAAVRRLAGVH